MFSLHSWKEYVKQWDANIAKLLKDKPIDWDELERNAAFEEEPPLTEEQIKEMAEQSNKTCCYE